MAPYILVILILLSSFATTEAAEQSITLAGMEVIVWSKGETKVRKPVIIFYHGFHGCGTQSRFLMDAFASAGYMLFAPNHRDATCHGGKASWLESPEKAFRKPETWSETSYRDRVDDISHLIDAIRTDDCLSSRVDWSRLGLAGHSLDGYTVLGIGGAWQSWSLSGIRAVLALSPYSQPFVLQKTLKGLSAPVMYRGGTMDLGITPPLHKSMGSYDQSPEPKYYVEFDKVRHFAWTDVGKISSRHGIIAYSLAFMNHYVKGEPADRVLTTVLPGVARFRYASEIGSNN